ncbi:MAG: 6-pyruvoyl-tetrahydropterin synthase-related protein, partial [Candidatus Hydrothermarchaeaceae archaeon]
MEKINVIVLFVIFAFLLGYFEPGLILTETTVAGGDTASHHAYAEYMKDYLLPHGKFSGWYPGAYAGFPVFVFYFFPPFMLAALMGHVIPLEIALKIVTVLGIFSLPVTTFLSMRFMRFRSPMPVIAAVFTLPFLFMEANSMWGGNIPSTLAGEFSYSISLSLAVLFVGLLYRRLEDNRGYLAPALLLFFVTLTHVYTTLFVVLCSVFFLLTRDRERFTGNFTFLFWVYLIPFLLAGFWTLPLVANMGYTTPYALVWDIKGIGEIFPPILYPFYLFAIFGLYSSWRHREKRIFFIAYSILTAFALYLVAPKLGIVDIRFLPFIQLFILFISAYGFVEVTKGLKGQKLLPLIAIVATIMWVNSNVTYIHGWIEWNYEGFENKPLWGAYSGVNEFLRGDVGDPRVVFEHSPLHNSAGSTRAFESLPLFSGRSTLEGLYMQSSPTAPFVFLIQSEISKVASCPFPQWPCARLNTTAAARHMEAFNVGQVVAVSKEAKMALKSDANYKLAASFPPYEIYDLVTNEGRYVFVPEYEPVRLDTEHFIEDAYLWFISKDVPLVFDLDGDLELKANSLDEVPEVRIDAECSIQEVVKNEEVRIKTDCVGKPHI